MLEQARQNMMHILSQISIAEMVMMAAIFILGLAVGMLMGGGSRREISELEDTIAILRARKENVVVAKKQEQQDDAYDDPVDSFVVEGSLEEAYIEKISIEKESLEKISENDEPDIPADLAQKVRIAQELHDRSEEKDVDVTSPEQLTEDLATPVKINGRLNLGVVDGKKRKENPVKKQGLAQPVRSSKQSRDLPPGSYDVSLSALSEELDKIRHLIRYSEPETDDLKEKLDQTDEAIKRANGRVAQMLRKLDKNK